MDTFDFEIKTKEREDFKIISDLLESNSIEVKKWKETNQESYLLTFQQDDLNADLIQSICDWFDCYEQQDNIDLGEVDIRISIAVSSSISNYDRDYSKTIYLTYS